MRSGLRDNTGADGASGSRPPEPPSHYDAIDAVLPEKSRPARFRSDPSEDEAASYRHLLETAASEGIKHLADLSSRQVVVPEADAELRDLLELPLPETSSSSDDVLATLLRAGELGVTPSNSPRYFGYVVGGSLPIAVAADWLTSAWDQCCIVRGGSPLTSLLEDVCGRWLVELFGLPTSAGVAFTPSCTYANLICLAAARQSVLARHGWNVAVQGLQGAPEVTVLVSAAIHASVLRSLAALGLAGNIKVVETDDQGRMLPDAIASAASVASSSPLIVCGQVGEVNTGAVDHLEVLCKTVHDAGGWVHLDGAFGLWAAATDMRQTVLDGLERADSWSTDAHKWLNVPYDCGIAFVADGEAHRSALAITPDYLHQDNPEQRHPVQWGLSISQRSRVIPVWAAMSQLGKAGIASMVEKHCMLARRLAVHLNREPGIHVVNEVELNQVAVRFENPTRDDEAHTIEVAEAFQRDGVAWAGTSRWNGRNILRLSIVNWATTELDIDQTAESLIRCHRALLDGSNSGAPMDAVVPSSKA